MPTPISRATQYQGFPWSIFPHLYTYYLKKHSIQTRYISQGIDNVMITITNMFWVGGIVKQDVSGLTWWLWSPLGERVVLNNCYLLALTYVSHLLNCILFTVLPHPQINTPVRHRWKLPMIHYHEIMEICPYPFSRGNHPIVILDHI